jgi:hypothetical protein
MKKTLVAITALVFTVGLVGICHSATAKSPKTASKAAPQNAKTTATLNLKALDGLHPPATADEEEIFKTIKDRPKKVALFVKFRAYMRVLGYPNTIDDKKMTQQNVPEFNATVEELNAYTLDRDEQMALINIQTYLSFRKADAEKNKN